MLTGFGLLLAAIVAAGPQDAVWDSEFQLTDSAYDEYTDWSAGKNVAVGPGGLIHVVWTVEDYFLPVPFQVFYKRFTPEVGWSADTCISADEMAFGRFSRYPSVVCDTSGRVHVVWMIGDSAGARNCVVYKRCTPVGPGNDGWQAGVTWLSAYSTTDLKFTPDVACSPDGHVHAVWSRQAGATNGIHYRESTDGGSNWQTEFAVFDTVASGGDQISPTVAAARNNTVHVAWCGHPYNGEAYHLYYRKRINTTWFAREGVVMSSASQYVPSIACSPLTNNPHIVWRRYFALDNYQIVYSYWDNTWQPVVPISDPSADTTQCNPQLVFLPDGSAHAVWRGWTGGASSLRQIRYATRSPAGVWTAAIDLTSATVRTRDFPSIAARGHDLHVVWQDDRGTYQNIYMRQGSAAFADVACMQLLEPHGTVDSGATVTPVCLVYNYDTLPATFMVRMRIGAGYNEAFTVTDLAGSTQQYVEFPDWTASARGMNAVRCSTELATDGDRSNDRQTGSVLVEVHDAGAAGISAPSGSVDSGAVVAPQAEVRNLGTETETFDIRFTISDGYDQTITRTMPAGGNSVFTFPDWTASATGGFVTRCSTQLAGDLRPDNDAAAGSVSVGVHDVGVTEILAPGDTTDSGTVLYPRAVVRNWGTGPETFRVRFVIDGAYAESLFQFLAAGEEDTAEFNPWSASPVGLLAMRCYSELAGDLRPDNDTAGGSVYVQPFTGVRASGDAPTAFAFDAAPNPSAGAVLLRVSCPPSAGAGAAVGIYDPAGRLVRAFAVPGARVTLIRWDGSDATGRDVGAGVFCVRVVCREAALMRRIVRLR